VGICIGASTVTMACIKENEKVIAIDKTSSISHEGNPREILLDLLNQDNIKNADRIVVTGRKLRHLINATALSEPEAIEEAYKYINKTFPKPSNYPSSPTVIVSAGGETFMVYKLDEKGRIIEVKSGNKCASGTGEFFLQQIKRMDLPIEEAIEIADSDNPYKVAGRCSVFCKSDCTHALNKGAAKANVVAGLCKMMADKITELLKGDAESKVMLVGGSSAIKIMVGYLKQAGLNVTIPTHSQCFEALGAALWALKNETIPININEIFKENKHDFPHHKPLSEAKSKVRFMRSVRGKANKDDVCILGLDVGSTTTKAVLMRKEDQAILAGIYLRTNGDPVAASRKCYEGINSQLDVPVNIIGLGITGSGRQISGLHALSPAVINEIIAHARAAAFFDPKVDTLFEIGGQDAKYTCLTNGVASDYAMNEACSAGTGSFLEESALEALNLKVEDIGEIAVNGEQPPNFNDQCAAFIGSDIKTAIQNGISKADIAAGLVYSICLNYLNRVKGNRAVGQKVFMQGGVCYNKAVPAAMANLTGREIIVPPEPGLMGAFGVALETMSMLDNGQIDPERYDLSELAERTVTYDDPFICRGGREKCDRKCQISRIKIGNKTYPFGGACNKYYNLFANKKEADIEALDLVALREKLLLEYAGLNTANNHPGKASPVKKVGINFSLMVNTLLPLYAVFFKALGYEVVYPVKADAEGSSRKGAAFCWPIEQAHGTLQELLKAKPDIIFLPHVKAFPVPGGQDVSVCCPFVQSEPYLLKSAFPELEKVSVLSPVLDMTMGYEAAEKAFVDMAKGLGHTAGEATAAFYKCLKAQNNFHEALLKEGKKVLKEIENSPDTAIILFGRPYNAFSGLGNMGIPKKLASRGYRVIPQDFLPVFEEDSYDKMYWASGQWILKAAHFVARHEKLFGVYITNFSCGPDSFLLTYYRNIMGRKPSLTLELDSHTADAGVDTRIEAFLDVVRRYRDMDSGKDNQVFSGTKPFKTAEVVKIANKVYVVTGDGEKYPI
ncbi:MAG: activase, partial [Clostridiaceae bacterium]|nr:activase [Clostridiaceae bacterium]